jgi:hypothetical protein
MAAASRLWRRAPGWRSAVILAVSTTIMALLFAPWKASPPKVPATGHYKLLTPSEVLSAARAGFVLVAGRQVPLPPGDWHGVTQSIQHDDPPMDSVLFVRVSENRVTGIVLARGTSAPSPAVRKLPYGTLCSPPKGYDGTVIPTVGAVRECWGMAPVHFPDAWRSQGTAALFTAALDRLADAGIELPPVMIAAGWVHVDETDWVLNEYFFDPTLDESTPRSATAWTRDAVAANPAASRFINRITLWQQRWTPLLEKGVNGGLTKSDITAVVPPDDPK